MCVVAKGDECFVLIFFDVFALEGGEGVGATGGDGDSFNSVTCFCGKPFAGRPMIECSGCLTWLHMSCAKVKRKNIPEFYYCDNCKSNSLLSPTMMNNTSSGEETLSPTSHNGTSTISSNTSIVDSGVFSTNSTLSAKPRKPKSMKKMMMSSSSDNIKNNASDSKKSSASSAVNGKLKKPSTKKLRQSPTKATKAYASSSLAAAASLTELSLNHQVSMMPNGAADVLPLLKSPIATNNNIYETTPAIDTENGGVGEMDKFNNKRLKTL